MKKLHKKHETKIKYLVVGGWNTIFGYMAFALLYFVFNRYLHINLILIFSYILSITNAYLGYKLFVFKTKGNYLREYFRFYLVYGPILLLNLLFLPVMVRFLKISPLLIQGSFVFITVALSYFGHKNFSFKERVQA